jgi:hypothetical protein
MRMINPAFNFFRIKILFFSTYKNAQDSRKNDNIATEWIKILDPCSVSVALVPPTVRS